MKGFLYAVSQLPVLPKTLSLIHISMLQCPEIHACTDVTGFGLLGHTDEMAAGSGVTIRIYSQRLSLDVYKRQAYSC